MVKGKAKTRLFWKLMIALGILILVFKWTHLYPAGSRWINTRQGSIILWGTEGILLAGQVWYGFRRPWERS